MLELAHDSLVFELTSFLCHRFGEAEKLAIHVTSCCHNVISLCVQGVSELQRLPDTIRNLSPIRDGTPEVVRLEMAELLITQRGVNTRLAQLILLLCLLSQALSTKLLCLLEKAVNTFMNSFDLFASLNYFGFWLIE